MNKSVCVTLIGIFLILTISGSLMAIVRCQAIGDEPESPCAEGDPILLRYRIRGLCIGFHICRVSYRFICIDADDFLPYTRLAYVEVVDFKCPGGW